MHRSACARARGAFPTVALLSVLAAIPAAAQHAHHPPDSVSPPPLHTAMTRMASGTAWLPDAVPVTALHHAEGPWRLMLDGRVTLQYVRQTGIRRHWQVGSTNWLMAMADRDAGGGLLQLRAMLSAEPATLTAMGYPLLLQVARAHRGGTLTDRQHPHDVFGEIAVRFALPLSDRVAAEVYAAAVGEPALGPVAYRHRPSAAHDPAAPLGHHAQDVTHTTPGVLTLGIFGARAKLEASLFDGRHADDNRIDLDLDGLRLDSWSGRLTANPVPTLSLHVGYARFGPGDGGHAGAHHIARRATASIVHAARLGRGRSVATAVVHGVNLPDDGSASRPATLVETTVDAGGLDLFARLEQVVRSDEELALTGSVPSVLTVRALSLGAAHRLYRTGGLESSVALRGTANFLPKVLIPYYGEARPLALMAYLSLRPHER